MGKENWQKNTVVIIATYSLEFLSQLKSEGDRPGLFWVRVNGKKYNLVMGKKCEVPVEVATALEKLSEVDCVVEIK